MSQTQKRPVTPEVAGSSPVVPVSRDYAGLMRIITDARQGPSLAQRLVMWLMPGRSADIERESREWFAVCPNCGLARSYWDIGGVRYKARSRGKRIGLRCPSCGKRSMHRVERRPAGALR